MNTNDFEKSLRGLADLRFAQDATCSYDLLADGLIWSDEKPKEHADWGGIPALRILAHHRTSLLRGNPSPFAEHWAKAAELIPEWPGFRPERCTPAPELMRMFSQGDRETRKLGNLLDRRE